MGIDPFTFAAQIINLLVLLYLLRRFLYLPVLKAVEARQKLIRGEFKKAEEAQASADRLKAEYLAELEDAKLQKAEILSAARVSADKLSAELQKKVEAEYLAERKEQQARLQKQLKDFEESAERLAAERFGSFAEKALRQIADADLNEAAVKKFMRRIKELPVAEKTKMRQSFGTAENITVVSAQRLSAESENKMKELLRSEAGAAENAVIRFETDPALVCGITVRGREYTLEWSLAEYAAEFRRIVSAELSALIKENAA